MSMISRQRQLVTCHTLGDTMQSLQLAPTTTFVEKRPGGCRSLDGQCQHLGLKYIKLSNGRVS